MSASKRFASRVAVARRAASKRSPRATFTHDYLALAAQLSLTGRGIALISSLSVRDNLALPLEELTRKSREEIEVGVDNAEALEAILRRLGYTAGFRYEKYRTEFMETGETGIVMLDETPIGVFLEIEGNPRWIDRTAARLGYSEPDYIASSYYELYREYCEQQSIEPGDLVF